MLVPLKPTSPIEFEQVLRHVQGIIENEQQRKELLGTKGDTAQQWLDLFQLLAEYPDVPNALRPSIFKLMIRLSRKSGLHPQCLTIRGVEKLGNHPVGGGAFGDVWQGRIGEQLVCLKVIRAFNRSDVQLVLKDYMQEGIVWRQLNHPNVLPFMGIYYLDTEQRQLCLVSPWMKQGNLVEFLKASDEFVDRVLLAYDVACGLAHLHEAGIVHGDLKGVNILITPELRACITDFGLSRVSPTLPLLTETSRSRGTTRWLSPELLTPDSNCVSSKQSDVYAYACVCYEIFTGKIPFFELAEAKIVIAVYMHKWRPSRPQDCPYLCESMWEMMGVCWNETPSLRPTMPDILVRVKEMNSDRQLEPASSWNNFAFTQIWRDVDRPPVVHSGQPQSRDSDLQSDLYAPLTVRALYAPVGNPRNLPSPLVSFEENDLRSSSGSYNNVSTSSRSTHPELAWTPAMVSFPSLTWSSSLDGRSSLSEVRPEPERFEPLASNGEVNTSSDGLGAPSPPLKLEQPVPIATSSVSRNSWESSEVTSDEYSDLRTSSVTSSLVSRFQSVFHLRDSDTKGRQQEGRSSTNPTSFNWVLGELIGEGSYGRVYLALNATTGELMAVKQVAIATRHPEHHDRRRMREVAEVLRLEKDTLARLDHPHIVRFMGFEETNECLSMFMEYVSGGTIGSWLSRHGPFEQELTKYFTKQILLGLDYLHGKGIIHRDLKAGNILIETSGVCKISDFGMSTQTDAEGRAFTGMRGTVFWMAPEVLSPSEGGYDVKVDIWSTGCVILEMWSGKRPWDGEGELQVLLKVSQQKIHPPLPPGFQIHLDTLDMLRKCFIAESTKRPSAAELLLHPYLVIRPGWSFDSYDFPGLEGGSYA